jgi:hypothetical protein
MPTATEEPKLFICVQIFSDMLISNKNASFFLFYPLSIISVNYKTTVEEKVKYDTAHTFLIKETYRLIPTWDP